MLCNLGASLKFQPNISYLPFTKISDIKFNGNYATKDSSYLLKVFPFSHFKNGGFYSEKVYFKPK